MKNNIHVMMVYVLIFSGGEFVRAATPGNVLVRSEGLVEAVYDATLSPEIAGIVASNVVAEGDWVDAGDLLVRFRDSIEALEVHRRKLILESTSELNAAKKRRKYLEKDLQSTRNLFKTSGSISEEELELKQLDFDLADADVQRLEMDEKREDAEYRMALMQLDMRKVVAPAAGEVTRLYVDSGEYINTGQPLLRLVDSRKCIFVSHLPAQMVRRIAVGKKFALEFKANEEAVRIPGKVIFISPVTDAASGLRMVKLEFLNPNAAISPGASGFLVVE